MNRKCTKAEQSTEIIAARKAKGNTNHENGKNLELNRRDRPNNCVNLQVGVL